MEGTVKSRQHDELSAEVLARSARIDRELRTRLVQAREDLEVRDAEVAQLQARLELSMREVETMRRSTSWRITRPLRRLRGGE